MWHAVDTDEQNDGGQTQVDHHDGGETQVDHHEEDPNNDNMMHDPNGDLQEADGDHGLQEGEDVGLAQLNQVPARLLDGGLVGKLRAKKVGKAKIVRQDPPVRLPGVGNPLSDDEMSTYLA